MLRLLDVGIRCAWPVVRFAAHEKCARIATLYSLGSLLSAAQGQQNAVRGVACQPVLQSQFGGHFQVLTEGDGEDSDPERAESQLARRA
jgi:hypothetical protein